MKLRNKKTGEIIDLDHLSVHYGEKHSPASFWKFSLAELNEEWEDYEEPKEYWYLENDGDVDNQRWDGDDYDKRMMLIGNYFETREEAERAVEKLKAWKRLRDNGVEFSDQLYALDLNGGICLKVYRNGYRNLDDDIDIIFGGEE